MRHFSIITSLIKLKLDTSKFVATVYGQESPVSTRLWTMMSWVWMPDRCILPREQLKSTINITLIHFACFTNCLNPLYKEQTLPQYILEESNFNFRYTRLWDLHIPREKWLNYLQTVETLIRRHVRHLIWVCTVCQLPFYGPPDYNGLKSYR